MRFLFFPSGSYIGGLETVTLGLMRELQAQGHPCYAVVSGWNDGRYPAMLTQAGVPYRSIKLGRFYLKKPSWTLDGLVNLPRARRELLDVIAEFRPDVMVLTGIEFALTVMHTAPRGVPYVLHLHDVPSPRWGSALGRHVLGSARGVITVSDFVRGRLAAVARPDLASRTVHNGLTVCDPAARPTTTRLRVGIVGQLMPRKRHGVLVDAIRLLDQSTREKIEVCIYGANTNSFASEIKRKIADAGLTSHFRWVGFVAQTEIYGNLDLVIAPAVEEPLGMTVLEAGGYGLPVVAARSGGFAETILDGTTGILVSPDDPQELAQALGRLFDESMRTRFGDNARRHISTNFTTAVMARKFVEATEAFGVRPAA